MSWRDTITKPKEETKAEPSWRDTIKPVDEPEQDTKSEALQALKDFGKATTEQLPSIGATVGGTVGGLKGSALFGVGALPGATIGATAGAAGGAALKNFINQYVYGEEIPTDELLISPAREGIEGAAGELAGGALGKVARSVWPAAKTVKDAAMRVPSKFVEHFAGDPAQMKANFRQIQEATRALGAEATPGMLADSKIIQNIESAIESSPTLTGRSFTEKVIEPVRRAMRFTADSVFKDLPNDIPSDVGRSVKQGIQDELENRLTPTRAVYDKIRESTQYIPVNPTSLKRITNSFLDAHSTFPNSEQARAARAISQDLKEIVNVDMIKQYRGQVGDLYSAAQKKGDDHLVYVYGDLYKRLSLLEQNTMMREAIKQSRTPKEGAKIGMELVDELKSANKNWKKVLDDIEEVAKRSGLKKPQSVDDFLRIIDDIPEEALADKLLNLKDKRSLEAMQNIFPDQYRIAREAKLGDLMKRTSTDGVVSPRKLVSTIEKLDDHTVEFLFGTEKKAALDNLKIVVRSFPTDVNPSGTARTLDLIDTLSVIGRSGKEVQNWIKAQQLMRQTGYQSPTKAALQQSASELMSTITDPIRYSGPKKTLMRSGMGQALTQSLVVPEPMTEEDVNLGDYSPTQRAKMINDIRRGKKVFAP
jgi:hypothetical protein